MKRTFKKYLCIFLSTLMIVQILPMAVWGAEVQNNQLPNISGSSETEDLNIVQELSDQSTSNQKVYLADNGSLLSVTDLNSTGNISLFNSSSNNTNESTIISYPEENNVNGQSKIGQVGEAGYIIMPNLEDLGNIYVENAYITFQCDYIISATTIYASAISSDFGGAYDTIDCDMLSDYVTIESNSANSTITLDITKILNAYLSGKENYGICVDTGDDCLQSDFEFDTETNKDALFSNPQLTINYKYLSDVDPNIESEIIDMGRAGTVYINDFTCAPTVVRNEIGLDGEYASVQLQSILNPYNTSESLTGSNFRFNYESNISFNNDYYIWKTTEGETLQFQYSKSTLTNKVYTAVDAEGNTITLNASATDLSDLSAVSITDEDNYKYKFNAQGYLSEILVNGNASNKISIAYSSFTNSNEHLCYRISTITDGSGRIYKFEYNSNHQLTNIKVTNSSNEALTIGNTPICISYTYNNDGLLSTVTYPDEESVEYTYDSEGRIEAVTSNSDKNITITYLNDSSYVVSDYCVTDSDNTVIDDITINTEEPYRRIFTNNLEKEIDDNKIKILDFDKSYNLIYLEDFDNKNYFLDYDDSSLKTVINDNSKDNLVTNGNFTNNITGWSKLAKFGTISATTASKTSNKERRLRSDSGCLRIKGSTAKDSAVYQAISGDFKAGEKYILDAYVSAPEAVPLNNSKKMGVLVATSENTTGVPVQSAVIAQMDYQPYINTWQHQKQIVTIPADTTTLYIYLYYGYMSDYCYFDSIKLYEYEETDNSTAIDRTEYTYDSNGRLTKESVTEKTPILGVVKAVKEKTYTYSGNNLSSVTDNGITTYYNYDSSNSLLNSYGYSTDSSNNIQYTYNGMGALESVRKAINQVENETSDGLDNMQINTTYAYEHDNITEITHNGFTYDISYDGEGNISEVSVGNKQIYSYDDQYESAQISRIRFGDGTSLIYVESVDENYYNVVTIYETKLSEPDINDLVSYKYKFKYDYDGTLVEYIDKANNTTSVWTGDAHAVYNSTDNSFLNNIDYIFNGTKELDELTEVPIYCSTETYSGTVLGQAFTQSNIDIFGDEYSILSSSTYSSALNRTTTTDRIFYGELSSLENVETQNDLNQFINSNNYTVAKTTTDGFGRTSNSSIISLLDGTGVYNEYSYKDLGSKKTTDLLSEYETYYGGISSSDQTVAESASLLYRRYEYEYNTKGQLTDVYLVSKNLFDESTLEDLGDGITSEKVQHYEYDELGQLVKEVNLKTNKAILYYYDQGGNITERRIYQNGTKDDNGNEIVAFTFDDVSNELDVKICTEDIVYGYNDSSWKDLMTSYNGTAITYDNAGNPLYYSGTNIFGNQVEGSMEWSGKNLTSFTDSKSKNYYEYEYNADGMRTKKTTYSINSNGDKTPCNSIDYIWENDVLVGYKMSSYNSDGTVNSPISLKPVYDENNNLMGIMYTIPNADNNDKTVITIPVLRDGLGNITDVYSSVNSTGLIFHYDYDAYGNGLLNFSGQDFSEFESSGSIILDILLAFIYTIVLAAVYSGAVVMSQQNYRGYLYDVETGLYYNQTRYYSPSWCRFINCDDVNVLVKDSGEVLGANLFKYCDNDPINYTDPSGFSKLSNLYDDSLLSLVGIDSTDATMINIAKSSTQNTLENKLIESSLRLTAQQQEIWSEVFDEKSQTVFKKNGYNYLSSQLNSSGNGKTKMYSSKTNTPYSTNSAKNN